MTEEDFVPNDAERFLQVLLDNMSEPIFFKDADSHFTRANTAFASLVGLADPSAIAGRTDADFFSLAKAQEFLADERHLLTAGEILITKPEAHLGADGQTYWLITSKAPVLGRDGHITGLVGIVRDVTELHRVEEDLRQTEERHHDLLAEARRQAQELALFDEVRTALAHELELHELFRTVVDAIARAFGYTLVSLYMLEDDVLVLQHQVGYHQVAERIAVTEGVSGRVIRTGKAVLLEDVQTEPAFIGAIPGILSEICVPLQDVGRVVGTLNVESRDGVRLTNSDLHLMVALSEHVNVAIGRARLYTEVRQREARFGSLIRNALDLITILDADGTIRFESPAIHRTLGYQPEELLGLNAFDLVHPEDLSATYAALVAALNDPALTPTVEFRFRHRNGSWRWLEARGTNLLADPAVGGLVINSRDVTERKESAGKLWHQAHHDALTGLPNRVLFLDRLKEALSKPTPSSVAVLFLDLDDFKVFNDSLGHEYGDSLLVAAAERLSSTLRERDLLARFGGDEFTILLEQTSDASDAILLADRLHSVLAAPFALNEHTLTVSTSVGIVLGSPALMTTTDLLRAADVALYRAKAERKGGTAVFDAACDSWAFEQLNRETALRTALDLGELRLHYQPLVDLATDSLVGVEALVRWQHPSAGLLLPHTFIRLAEETGLTMQIGAWVLREACRQAMAWHELFPKSGIVGMSVNVSPSQVRHPDFVDQVVRTLRETGFPPERLTLEITERGLIQNAKAADHSVAALQALGVQLAIDDFGVEQAGISYLRRWALDKLKVDRTMVAVLDRDERTRAIVAAVVGLAQTLGMAVTGEGIETAEQLKRLREMGCDSGQGYFIAAPMPASELVDYMERRTSVSNER